MLQTSNLPLLDLVNEDLLPLLQSQFAPLLTLILLLEILKSFNLHHKIELLLFLDPLLLKSDVFFKLLVPDRSHFGIEHHLIHVLDIILLFVKLHLCLGK